MIRFLVQSVIDKYYHMSHQDLVGLSRTLMNSVMNKYENICRTNRYTIIKMSILHFHSGYFFSSLVSEGNLDTLFQLLNGIGRGDVVTQLQTGQQGEIHVKELRMNNLFLHKQC